MVVSTSHVDVRSVVENVGLIVGVEQSSMDFCAAFRIGWANSQRRSFEGAISILTQKANV